MHPWLLMKNASNVGGAWLMNQTLVGDEKRSHCVMVRADD